MVHGSEGVGRECSPFRLLLLGLVAMLKAAINARMKSGRMRMTRVVRERGCNGIDYKCNRR